MLKKTRFKRRYYGDFNLVLASMLSILALILSAGAHPEMPHTFYGTVSNAPNMTAITAVVNSTPVSSTITDGWYTNLDVPADDPDTPTIEGGKNGEIIYFYISGRLIGTFVFNTGGFDRLDFNISIIQLLIDPVTNKTNTTVTSATGNVSITVPNGTSVIDTNGSPITNISINSSTTLPGNASAALLSDDRVIGEIVHLEPEGTRFDPPMQIRFNYTEPLESGVSEDALEIKFFNTTTNGWEALQIIEHNTVQNYITANISHFSTFALIGRPVGTSSSGSGSGGGGGGGGGGTSSENYTNIELREKYDLFIFKDITTSYYFNKSSNPITFINITGNTNAGEITVAVEVLRNTSSLVKTLPEGIIYKNINIWAGASGFATPRNIKHAEIAFRVPKTWIENSKIDPNSLKLSRYDGAWKSLPAQKIGENNEELKYEASTDSFSPFVITANKLEVTGISFSDLVPSGTEGAVPPEKAITSEKTKAGEPKDLSGLNILLFIIAFAAIASLIYGLRETLKR